MMTLILGILSKGLDIFKDFQDPEKYRKRKLYSLMKQMEHIERKMRDINEKLAAQTIAPDSANDKFLSLESDLNRLRNQISDYKD